MFRFIKSVVAASTLLLAGIGLAIPAHAASTSPADLYYPNGTTPNNCATTGEQEFYPQPGRGGVSYLSGDTITGEPGDTITIHNECASTIWVDPGDNPSTLTLSIASGSSLLVTLAGSPGLTIAVKNGNSSSDTTLAYVGTSAPGPTPTPTPSEPGSSTSSTGPAPVLQQFGMPATGTCNEAQPEGLNWSGVAGGGWGISWAQWVDSGNGGAVCSRTLIYSTAQSKWVVN